MPAPDLKAIFQQALDLDPADRSAFLDRAVHRRSRGQGPRRGAAEGPGRRRELPRSPARDSRSTPRGSRATATPPPAIDTRAKASSRLEATPGAHPSIRPPTGRPPRPPARRIGPYKLLQQIGEGGMGAVFMAEQEQPVRREVALKVIKPGMDTGRSSPGSRPSGRPWRMMDHPNIARVLDAGATDAGRPYFVMELVKGVPITEYCDAAPASRRGSGWSCSSRSARRSSTRTRRGSSTATSSRRTCW